MTTTCLTPDTARPAHTVRPRRRPAAASRTARVDEILARYGLHPVAGEWMLRRTLTRLPHAPVPPGARLVPASEADPAALLSAYEESFRDRATRAAPTPRAWLQQVYADAEYRPDLSLVATDERGAPIGLVTVFDTRIDQVGVVPGWRGRGLGAALVSAVLTSLSAAGEAESRVSVGVDDPSAGLFRRLGYDVVGHRGRYATNAKRAGGD